MLSGLKNKKNQLKKLKYRKKPTPSVIKPPTALIKPQLQTINHEIMHQRRQNILNSKFNVRKNKLKQISKDNLHIHKRINSQTSLYSHKRFEKSYSQLRSISSSRASLKQKKQTTFRTNAKPKTRKYLTIQQENINHIRETSLKDFQGIFKRQKDNYNRLSKSISNQCERVSYPHRSLSIKPINEGNMLHRVAQQIYGRFQGKKHPY